METCPKDVVVLLLSCVSTEALLRACPLVCKRFWNAVAALLSLGCVYQLGSTASGMVKALQLVSGDSAKPDSSLLLRVYYRYIGSLRVTITRPRFGSLLKRNLKRTVLLRVEQAFRTNDTFSRYVLNGWLSISGATNDAEGQTSRIEGSLKRLEGRVFVLTVVGVGDLSSSHEWDPRSSFTLTVASDEKTWTWTEEEHLKTGDTFPLSESGDGGFDGLCKFWSLDARTMIDLLNVFRPSFALSSKWAFSFIH